MSLLIAFPIKNCESRITPFFNSIKNSLDLDSFEVIFIIEQADDESLRVLNYEIDISGKEFVVINPERIVTRGDSYKIACEYADSRSIKNFAIFNEGWEDTVEEFFNIFQTKEYESYDLYIGCRHVYEKSLGTLINISCNVIYSLRFSRPLLETKGDSINIINTAYLTQKQGQLNLHKHFLPALMVQTDKSKLAFSVVDNGLNYPSLVKLNLKYLINCLLFVLFKIQR
jgi:hypothetical protein